MLLAVLRNAYPVTAERGPAWHMAGAELCAAPTVPDRRPGGLPILRILCRQFVLAVLPLEHRNLLPAGPAVIEVRFCGAVLAAEGWSPPVAAGAVDPVEHAPAANALAVAVLALLGGGLAPMRAFKVGPVSE